MHGKRRLLETVSGTREFHLYLVATYYIGQVLQITKQTNERYELQVTNEPIASVIERANARSTASET